MSGKRPLTSEEISAIVDGFDPIDLDKMERLAKLSPGERMLACLQKAEILRSDLSNKLMKDFPELTLSEINMKVLRSFTPVRIGKDYSEPPYYGSLC